MLSLSFSPSRLSLLLPPSSGLVTSHLACHSSLITGFPLVYLSKCRDLAEISPKHGSQQPPHTLQYTLFPQLRTPYWLPIPNRIKLLMLLLKCPPDLGQPSHQTLLWIFAVCALGCTDLVNVLPSPPPYTLLALCLNHPLAPNSH